MTRVEFNRFARWAPPLATAVLGGLLAAGGYVWAAVTAEAYEGAFGTLKGFPLSTVPCDLVFLGGSIALLFALTWIRVRSRPKLDGHLIWVSVGLGGLAITLGYFGTADTNSLSAASSWLELSGFGVGFFAVVICLVGIVALVMRRRESRTSGLLSTGSAGEKPRPAEGHS